MSGRQTNKDLPAENAELHRRLEDAEEISRAITGGEVDGLLVQSERVERVVMLGAPIPFTGPPSRI
jgi:hypothetical protein